MRFQAIEGARWNAYDPISRQSYRIGLIEHWLLTRADGKHSAQQLIRRLRNELANVGLTDEQLLSTISTFHRNGLLWTPERSEEEPQANGRLQSWLASVVVWQIRGVQPDRWLAEIAPHFNCLFSAGAVKFWLGAALLTIGAVLLEFHRLSAQSLSLDWILHPATGGMLFFVFLATRAAHELGHALVCARFAIRCPDIGLLVILGAPCIYCDVSESWQLPRRWQRAAVAAAGMYVELIIATLAALVWLATIDGPVNTLAFQAMFVCSISTVVINANPLMRFDGYHLLADWLDEVNLRAKSDAIAGRYLHRLVLGATGSASTDRSARRRFLAAFSIAGWVYRALLSLTIAAALIALYSHWNLAWIGRFLASAVLVSWWGVPAVKLTGDLVRGAKRSGRQWRLAAFASALVVVGAFAPIPSRRFATGWLQPVEARGVYVGKAARLIACSARDGQLVREGESLFQLQDQELSARLLRCQRATDIAEIRLEAGTRRRDMHSQEIDLQRFANDVEEARNWTATAQGDLNSMTLRAPMSGRLVAMLAPAPEDPNDKTTTDYGNDASPSMASWCDVRHIGRSIPQGSLLACVCSEPVMAVIPLEDQQLDAIAVGTRVRLRIPEKRTVLRETQVASIVQIDQLSSPWQAAAAFHSTARFAAVIEFPADMRALPGTTVDAVFVAEATTLASAAFSWLRANLRLFAD